MNNIYDVLIIGSGPAGLTAGIYAARAELLTLIIGGAKPLGQLVNTTAVENFPGFPEGVLGPKLMEMMKTQAEKFGVNIINENVSKVDFFQRPFKVWVEEKEFLGKSVIIATGTKTKWLEIPSEKKFIGRGVSGCATCDGFFFKGKKVVVVGGGDTALEEAIFLTRFATEVTVIHRRDTLRASKAMQSMAFANPKIKFIWNSTVEEIIGDEKVQELRIKNYELRKEIVIPCDGVFVAIGNFPQTEVFRRQAEVDEKGFIIINQKSEIKDQNLDQKLKTERREKHNFKMMTNIDGVFAAGDCHDSVYKQAITAAGFGCMAALEAEKWLQENKFL